MRLVLCTLAATALLVAPAAAHVQVRPSEAAPEDPVLFEVLVPNEDEKPTVKVEVAVPNGVIPFSFEEVPGWTRRVTMNPNGSTRSIVWSGRLPAGAFARFTFLASTPTREGTIAWKALQTYAGGEVVRWIGLPDSEEPAATTRIGADVPRQNAGGEAEGEEQQQGGSSSRSEVPAAEPEGGSDTTARALGGAGLALGAIALVLSLVRRRAA